MAFLTFFNYKKTIVPLVGRTLSNKVVHFILYNDFFNGSERQILIVRFNLLTKEKCLFLTLKSILKL